MKKEHELFIFREFLKKENVLSNYVHYTKQSRAPESLVSFLKHDEKDGWLMCAFCWPSESWRELDNKWRKLILFLEKIQK